MKSGVFEFKRHGMLFRDKFFGVHEKPGTPVLYSDGTVQVLSTEDAEKLVRERSPAPLEIKKPEDRTGQDAEP